MVYQVYKVLDGDTFDSIALNFNISSDELSRINGFSDFNVDDLIVVPNNDMYFTYSVKSGDTMYSIASKFKKDVNDLYLINGIKEGDFIYTNQEILIPNRDVFIYYTGSDDTFKSISNNIGMDIEDIVNNNSDLVLIPNQIIVYRKG